MTIDVNDPRLTAFVLGELEADESELVAAAVAESPELQAEVAGIRAAVGHVTTALALEPAPSLLPEQRAAIFESAGRAATVRERGSGETTPGSSTAPHAAASKILSLYSDLRAAAAVLVLATGATIWHYAVRSPAPSIIDPQPLLEATKSDGLHDSESASTADSEMQRISAVPGEAEERGKEKIDQLFRSALDAQKKRRFHDASECMTALLALDPGNQQAQYLKQCYDDAHALQQIREQIEANAARTDTSVAEVTREFPASQPHLDASSAVAATTGQPFQIPWTSDILKPREWASLSVRPDGHVAISGDSKSVRTMEAQLNVLAIGPSPGPTEPGQVGNGARFLRDSDGDGIGSMELARFGAVAPGFRSGRYLIYGRSGRFPSTPNISYGYQMPKSVSNEASDSLTEGYHSPADPGILFSLSGHVGREDSAQYAFIPEQMRNLIALGYSGRSEAMTEELWAEGESPLQRDAQSNSQAREVEVARLLVDLHVRASRGASEDPASFVASRLGMTEADARREIEEVERKIQERDPQLVPELGDIPRLGLLLARPPYPPLVDNPFLPAYDSPLSTFSIDVDTAAYTIVRRQILRQERVAPDSVRIEELVNYFPYDYAPPTDPADPFATHIEIASCPWRPEHRLVRIGLKGREIEAATRPSTNLVFLIDVSGSMQGVNRLPLVQKSLKMLVDQLAARAADGGAADDRIALTVYAGNAGLVQPSTSVRSGHDEIIAAIDRLQAGGSTNGGEGIALAYQVARQNFVAGGVNRVILATDGDWNVGVTDNASLETLIQEQAKSGVYLSVLGFGIENLNDHMLEMLADKGDGNYAYIDTENEARKALVDQLDGTLVTIAKDVKIQVEFNPALVAAYRLIGYENRVMPAEDFNDDTKDAGEIGAGHTVTALYEVVPTNAAPGEADADPQPDAQSEETTDLAGGIAVNSDGNSVQDPDFVGPPAPFEARDVERTAANWEAGLPDVLDNPAVDPLKYLSPLSAADALLNGNGELLTVKLRYKLPEGGPSLLHEYCAVDLGESFEEASTDFRFAASVAAFGMSLRHSSYRGSASAPLAHELAQEAVGEDSAGLRADFVHLLEQLGQ